MWPIEPTLASRNLRRSVLVAVSSEAVALPLPALVTGGSSLAPPRSALKLICSACATPKSKDAARTQKATGGAKRMLFLPSHVIGVHIRENRPGRLPACRRLVPRCQAAGGLRHAQHRLAANCLGGQAGQLHLQLSLPDMAELGAQSRLGPQRELAFEIGLSLEEDRRARAAHHLREGGAPPPPGS